MCSVIALTLAHALRLHAQIYSISYTVDIYKLLLCGIFQNPSLNVTWSSGTKISCSAARSSTTPWWTVTGKPWTQLVPPSPPSLDNSPSSDPSLNLKYFIFYFVLPIICHDLTPHWHLQEASFSSLSQYFSKPDWRLTVHTNVQSSSNTQSRHKYSLDFNVYHVGNIQKVAQQSVKLMCSAYGFVWTL